MTTTQRVRPADPGDVPAIVRVYRSDLVDGSWWRFHGKRRTAAHGDDLTPFEQWLNGGPWMNPDYLTTHLRRLAAEGHLAYVAEELVPGSGPGAGWSVRGEVEIFLYREAAGEDARCLTFIPQRDGRGYAHAVYCAREFAAGGGFLHVVGDHIYISADGESCARALVELAEHEHCPVSAVQPTPERLLPHYGTVGGPRLGGRPNLYRIETVVEKPTPTEAEQRLTVTGLRAGYYLCFFGMHVLTPAVFDVLGELLAGAAQPAAFSDALAELARREQYLALVSGGRRYDLGVRYGFLAAQLALALHGREAADVLSRVLEVVASRKGAAAHE